MSKLSLLLTGLRRSSVGMSLAAWYFRPAADDGRKYHYRRFIVAAYERSGSTMLVSALDGHPDIRCYSEVFNQRHPMFMAMGLPEGSRWLDALRTRDPSGFVRRFVFRGYADHVTHVGFKVFPEHARDQRFAATIATLFEGPDVGIIHLRRRNKLAMYLSRVRARQTSAWTSARSEHYSDAALRLDPTECIAQLEALSREEAEFARLFAERPHLTLDYEDILAAPDVAYQRSLDYLGAAPAQLTPRIAKQRSRPLREVIENFDELARVHGNGPFAHCFTEDEIR